jgi:hypothetical protein
MYRLDGVGKIISADWIEADADAEAARQAQEMMDGHRFELWQRDRLVIPAERN